MQEQFSQKERKQMAAKLGRLGGQATVRKHGKAYMSELARLGGKARWVGYKK